MACLPEDPISLQSFIDGSFVDNNMRTYNFNGFDQKFLPKRALDKATEKHVIKEFVRRGDIGLSPSAAADFVDCIFDKARKLFIISMFCGLGVKFLKALLDKKLTDKDLPLSTEHYTGEDRRAFNSGFLGSQRCFNTATFEMNSHQVLNCNHSIPIDVQDSIGKGAFGEVFRVMINNDHYSFDERSEEDLYAIKVIKNEASSDREKKFNSEMTDLKHPNLIKCLSSFTFATYTYLIYPLADSNLEDYIMKHSSNLSTEYTSQSIAGWIAEQLCGLAAAVHVVHNQEEAPKIQTYLDVGQAASGKTGYVHDIKLENILVITRKDQLPLFRLSDFSCAKVVDFVTSVSGKRNTHLTVSKSGTPNYRPPESQTGMTSRPYDLWSLGCVYLELLTWYLEDYAALEKFREDRNGLVGPGKQEDQGFYEVDDNGNCQLREAVTTKLDELQPLCQGPLKEILDVISDLLTINPKQRITAAEMVQRLPLHTFEAILVPVSDTKRRDSMLSVDASPRPRRALPAVENSIISGGPDITIQVQAPTDE